MPTIRISQETKTKLEILMSAHLNKELIESGPELKEELLLQLIKKKFGFSYDTFINKLMDTYTDNTK